MKSERTDYPAICGIRGVINQIIKSRGGIPVTLDSLYEVQSSWRSLLIRLRDSNTMTGNFNMTDKKIYEACYNCRLPLVEYEGNGTTQCYKPTLCPFCNCRELEEVFRTISKNIPSKAEQLDKLTFHLFEKYTYVEEEKDLAPSLAAVSYFRDDISRWVKPLGAVFNTTTGPMMSHFTGRMIFKLSYRGLFLLNKGKEPGLLFSQGSTKNLGKADRKTLCKGLAEVFKYPAELLQATPDVVASIIDARSNLRMSALYGVFRNPRKTNKRKT